MELSKARDIAESLKTVLEGSCEFIEIVGSVRRLKPFPNDIEFLCIPKFVDGIDQLDRRVHGLIFQGILALRLNKLGRKVYGPKNKLLRYVPSGIGVDIFSTTEECWAVSLVVRTGGKKTNQFIAMAALERGYQFHAYGSGFSTPHGEIVCRSEREVFGAVGLPYQDPWERR